MQRNAYIWCLLLFVLAMLAPTITQAKLASLGNGIDLAVPLTASTVLCSDEENNLLLLRLPGGERQPWPGVWDAQAAGWADTGRIATLCASPDGQWVCYSVNVSLPDEYELEFEGMRYGLAVILARADGSQAKCVALSIEVGGGPEFAFTQDNALLVGSPFLACPPTPAGYAAYINAEPGSIRAPEFNCIEVPTGATGIIPDLNVGDGFWKCPYSDNYRIENNWYAEHNFSSFITGGLIGTFTAPDEMECRVYGWVLPDALLIEIEGQYGLLYTSGEFKPTPASGLQVRCWLPDGSYLLYENEDSPMLHARVDWDTWRIEDEEPVPDFPELEWPTLIPLLDSSGVLINEYGPSELRLLTFD